MQHRVQVLREVQLTGMAPEVRNQNNAEKAGMAAERLVRGRVHREDGLAKTSLSNNFSLRALGMSSGRFVWL